MSAAEIDTEPEILECPHCAEMKRSGQVVAREFRRIQDENQRLHRRAIEKSAVAPTRRDRERQDWSSNGLTLAGKASFTATVLPNAKGSVGITINGWIEDGEPWEIEVGNHLRRTAQSDTRWIRINLGSRSAIVRQHRLRISHR